MKLKLYGKEIKTIEDIEEAIYEEVMEDPDLYMDICGNLPTLEDKDDYHDFCCDEFETDDEYEAFKKILESAEKVQGIEFDYGDGMYMMSGGGFSSWGDYYSYRFG